MDDNKSFTATYLADKERSVRLIHWLLKTTCLWPLSSNASVGKRIFSEFLIFVWYSFIFGIIIPFGLAIFCDSHGNMEMMMMHVGPFIYFVMTSVKYSCLLLHFNDIRSCIECIETDWKIMTRGEDRNVMLKYARIGRLAAILLAAFMHLGVQSYNITRCLVKDVVKMDNSSILIHELPYPFYNKILDVRFSPIYETILVVQCISSFLVSGVTIAICGLTVIFVMHACGQLKILKMRLGYIVDGEVKTVQQRLGFIVEHHLRVINFVSHIEEVIHLTCLVELITISLALCLLGYCSIMEWNQNRKQNIPTYCMISVSFMLNMFVLCYIGEMLSEKYRQVGIATYMTEWYRLPRKTALGLLLINMRCNFFDINLTAGKMFELSLSTFANLLKASMTYLNMLRAMTL